MQNVKIKYTIQINKGKKQGEIVIMKTTIEELEDDGLPKLLINAGHLDCWCNDNEYTILHRTLTILAV